ncbi:MAG: gas vesicle protein GvpG [Prochlorothrix sp.]
MILILQLVFAPLTAPVTGVMWIGKQILERADGGLSDKEALQKELLALQLDFDLGDIEEEEFEEREEELLLAIQAIEDEEAAEESEG